MTRVGVVGGGITGLALTHALAARGVESVTLEARAEPGGVIRSAAAADTVLEYGPQRLRLTGAVADLVDDVGLRDELVTARPDLPLYVYADGRLRRVPRSIGGFLSTDLLSWRGKLRAALEPLTAPIDPSETVEAAFRRKFGDEVASNIAGPLVGGIYASTPDRLPAGHAVGPLLALEARRGSLLRAALRRARSRDVAPPATFRTGLQALPAAIARRHADRVRFGEPATAVEAADGAYRLRSAGGVETVDAVVVTASAPAAAALLEGVAPAAADALRRLRYNPLAVVHLRSDVDRAGFGYQVRPGEGLRTLGVTWNAGLFDRDGLYTCFLGGMRDPGILEEPPGEIGRVAREEFAAVMGAPAEVLDVTTDASALPAHDASWDALGDLDLPAGVRLATNYTGRLGIPARVREAARVAAAIAP